jgi:hypothetical protein
LDRALVAKVRRGHLVLGGLKRSFATGQSELTAAWLIADHPAYR